MKTTSFLVAATMTLSSVFTLGCRKDTVDDETYDDVAVAVGSLVANDSGGEVGSMNESVALSGGQEISAFVAAAKRQVVRAGLSYEYDLTCFDAAGTEQAACDAATTDSADVSVTWSGSLDLPRYDSSINRTGQWSLSGLLGDITSLNGTGTFAIDSSFEAMYRPVTRTLSLDYQAEYDEVQIDRANERIVGGTIHYSIEGQRDVQRGERTREGSFSIDAVVTFDGTGVATVTLDGSRTYTVNLGTGAVAESDGQ